MIVISHLVHKELLYKSYLNDVILSLLFIVKCIVVGCLQPLGITNGYCNSPIHDLLTPITLILLSVKLNKMLNIKTKFDTFQILGKEEFSKRTNTRS